MPYINDAQKKVISIAADKYVSTLVKLVQGKDVDLERYHLTRVAMIQKLMDQLGAENLVDSFSSSNIDAMIADLNSKRNGQVSVYNTIQALHSDTAVRTGVDAVNEKLLRAVSFVCESAFNDQFPAMQQSIFRMYPTIEKASDKQIVINAIVRAKDLFILDLESPLISELLASTVIAAAVRKVLAKIQSDISAATGTASAAPGTASAPKSSGSAAMPVSSVNISYAEGIAKTIVQTVFGSLHLAMLETDDVIRAVLNARLAKSKLKIIPMPPAGEMIVPDSAKQAVAPAASQGLATVATFNQLMETITTKKPVSTQDKKDVLAAVEKMTSILVANKGKDILSNDNLTVMHKAVNSIIDSTSASESQKSDYKIVGTIFFAGLTAVGGQLFAQGFTVAALPTLGATFLAAVLAALFKHYKINIPENEATRALGTMARQALTHLQEEAAGKDARYQELLRLAGEYLPDSTKEKVTIDRAKFAGVLKDSVTSGTAAAATAAMV